MKFISIDDLESIAKDVTLANGIAKHRCIDATQINELPSVEIVRCKDCKFRDETTEDCANIDSVCYRNGFSDGNWYCADGKRKDDEKG